MADPLKRAEITGNVAADLTAAAPEAAVAELPPEVVAQSLGEYVRGYVARIRAGESGVLPVVIAMAAIVLVFQVISPTTCICRRATS